MKVLFVTENLGSGGAERQLTGLAAMMAHDDVECTVVTWVDKNFHARILEENGVEHILLRPNGKIDRVLKLASLYRHLNPDAVIAFLPMANETALLASMLWPVKVIVSERSFTTNWGLRRKLTNILYRQADYIVANSNNEAENIRNHCPRLAKKTIAIPNFVDTEQFKPIERKWQSWGKLRIVGVGRVIPSKNLLNLANALALVKKEGFKFELRWYGDTYDKEYLTNLKSLICELSLQNEFKIMGECQEMSKVYDDADFFVMPSLIEGYPNVLIEAMASGLPVIVSNVCEHPYIVESGSNGFLFDPYNVNAIADAIEQIAKLDTNQLRTIAENNRQKVAKNNSPDSFLQSYIKLITI